MPLATVLVQGCVLYLCACVAGQAHMVVRAGAALQGAAGATSLAPPARRSVIRRQDTGAKILGKIERMLNLQGDLYQMTGWVRAPHCTHDTLCTSNAVDTNHTHIHIVRVAVRVRMHAS